MGLIEKAVPAPVDERASGASGVLKVYQDNGYYCPWGSGATFYKWSGSSWEVQGGFSHIKGGVIADNMVASATLVTTGDGMTQTAYSDLPTSCGAGVEIDVTLLAELTATANKLKFYRRTRFPGPITGE